MHRPRFALPLLFCTLTAGVASASQTFYAQDTAVIFDNIPGSLSGLAYTTTVGTASDNFWALQFETPAGNPVDLASVELALSELPIGGPSYIDDPAEAFLYDDNSNVPGTEIQEIGTQTVTNYLLDQSSDYDPQLYTFTAGTSIELQPATQYWIVLADGDYASGHQIVWWDEAGFTSTEPTAGITYEYNAEWTGSSWTLQQQNYQTGWLPVMQVSVTPAPAATPEPVTGALAGAGFLALAVVLRRRRAWATR
jgi:MYXO-CTERM domain-containing protein